MLGGCLLAVVAWQLNMERCLLVLGCCLLSVVSCLGVLGSFQLAMGAMGNWLLALDIWPLEFGVCTSFVFYQRLKCCAFNYISIDALAIVNCTRFCLWF